jgi:L-asparaginase / beta-aspartyl-peptidase
VLIVHGGCGTPPPGEEASRNAACERSADAGWSVLRRGGNALDAQGRLAAATSTGGTGQCYPGRVGDTPVIGAGTYCTPRVGVSMTGVGERILVKLAAKRLADLVGDGAPLADAALRVLGEVGPGAGLVAIGAGGTLVEERNTPFMATARRSS